MTITDAQADMRRAHYGGGPGALTSGLVWLLAGSLLLLWEQDKAIIAFLIGGMFIYPVSTVITRMLGRSAQHDKSNPLAPLGLETTFMMLLGIAVSAALYLQEPLWFFPAMLFIIGGRYLTFATLYGMKTYWLLGGLLALAGYLVYAKNLPIESGAFLGGLVEIIFAFILMRAVPN